MVSGRDERGASQERKFVSVEDWSIRSWMCKVFHLSRGSFEKSAHNSMSLGATSGSRLPELG